MIGAGRHAGLFAASLLAAGVSPGVAAVPEPLPTYPSTITPYQTSAYVGDPSAAKLLNDLTEFAASLLVWEDTPRERAVRVATQLPKSMLVPFLGEFRSGGPSRLGADAIRAQVSAAYAELASPRFIRIELDRDLEISAPALIDTSDDDGRVPLLITNRRAEIVSFTIRELAAAGESTDQKLELQPAETRGLHRTIATSAGASPLRLHVTAGQQSREVVVPVRRRPTVNCRLVVFDSTGQPTPARVYVTSADGRARVPRGTMQRSVTGEYSQPFPGEVYFYTPGVSELQLPSGPAKIEVVKGFEYQPQRVQVEIRANDPPQMEIRLTRNSDLAALGWHSGDNHVHGNLFADDRIKPADVLLIAQAEDLNVVNVLPTVDPQSEQISDGQHFEGRPHALSTPRHVLYYHEELRNNLYHHVAFLGLKRFITPGYSGWPRTRFPFDDIPNFELAQQAKAQGAMVVYVHPAMPSEFPVDLALGVADTMDLMSQLDEEANTADWYRLLNCGFRVPASAGTDCFLNVPCHLVAGAGRVYVKSSPELHYEDWLEGLRRGRSFVTNGPLLEFTVNGREPGDEITGHDDILAIDVRAQARSIVPMSSLELVVNGRTVAKVADGTAVHTLTLAHRLELRESSWIALRVRGPGHRFAPNDREVYAHTSPVYVTLRNRPVADRAAAEYFVTQIEQLIARVSKQGNFSAASRREEVIALFRRGQDVFRRIGSHAQH